MIQAETNGAISIVGCVGILDNVTRVVTLSDLRLLGINVRELPPPNKSLERTRER